MMFVGNWKLNHFKKETLVFLDEVLPKLPKKDGLDIVIAPVITLLDCANSVCGGTSLKLAAQNVSSHTLGSFTGEYSAAHLAELGCSYCLVGHSERRRLFFESDEEVGKKARACFLAGITPICCIGETEEERKQGLLEKVLLRQILAIINETGSFKDKPIIFAYEPIWAIGRKESANSDEISEAHAMIYGIVSKNLSLGSFLNLRILYGGSVDPKNIAQIIAIPRVDGVLVGGASLQVDSFLSMVDALVNKKPADFV